jgi:SAM-dependent methyltransferase
MSDARERHAEQLAYWNGDGGGHWVAQQAHTDAVLAPVADALIAHAAPGADETVLDIGCGCGATTLLLAPLVARVIALDVSEPMLAVARRRAAGLANIAFVDADAASYATPSPCDLLVSRFGVMFFGDPVAAFANLRRSARPGGRLVFACWRAIGENPWMQVPLHAAYQHIPRLPKPEPDAPGPFAFADPDRVTSVLTGAGWPAPHFSKLDVMLDIAAGGGLEAAVHQATHIGAASRALREAPEDSRPAAIDAIRAALAPHGEGGRVALAGGIWLVTSENNE